MGEWIVQFGHMLREGNHYVDFLTKRGALGEDMVEVQLKSSLGLEAHLRVDIEGSFFMRE